MKVASSPCYMCGSRFSDRQTASPQTKKENYKMVVLSLGTDIFSFLPSFRQTDLRRQFRNFVDVLLNRIERQSGTGIVTASELSLQLLERPAPCLALGQPQIHVFGYQFRLSALVAKVVSIVRFNRVS